MLLHLPIVILASFPLTEIADSVPKFDIAAECKSEGGAAAIQQQCAADEAQARDEVQPLWTQSAAIDKAQCIQETSMDSTPSYVELLTCLEMARDVRKK
jgi:hypothetical protein